MLTIAGQWCFKAIPPGTSLLTPWLCLLLRLLGKTCHYFPAGPFQQTTPLLPVCRSARFFPCRPSAAVWLLQGSRQLQVALSAISSQMSRYQVVKLNSTTARSHINCMSNSWSRSGDAHLELSPRRRCDSNCCKSCSSDQD